MKGLKEREYTMSDLSKKMENIIKEIEEKISNPEECEFVKEKIAQTSLMHISIIEKKKASLYKPPNFTKLRLPTRE